jgi:hypothetical protein
MSLDAMKLALEALESNPDAMVDCGGGHWEFKRDLAITPLRAAIKEAEKQEPVAVVEYMNTGGNAGIATRIVEIDDPMRERLRAGDKLYAAPRQWQGLTDEEIAELHHEIKVRLIGTYKTEDIYRAIEAKLKEKNG